MTYNWQTKRTLRRVVGWCVYAAEVVAAIVLWQRYGAMWGLGFLVWGRVSAHISAVEAKLDDLIEFHRYREAVQTYHQ